MDVVSLEPEEIQRAMQQVRCNLGNEVDIFVQQARDATDWRHYVRRYPWFCLGATAATGYFCVPRGKPKVSSVPANPTGDTGPAKGAATGGVAAAVTAMLIRTAANALLTQGMAFLRQKMNPESQPPIESQGRTGKRNEAAPW
jgi:hypothetical protein